MVLVVAMFRPLQYKGTYFRAKVEHFAREKLLLVAHFLFEHDVLFE